MDGGAPSGPQAYLSLAAGTAKTFMPFAGRLGPNCAGRSLYCSINCEKEKNWKILIQGY